MSKEMLGSGVGVTLLGRSGIRYREGTATVFIDGEMLTGLSDFVVYTKSINAWEGTSERITDEKKREILANMKSVFLQHGLVVKFE